MPKTILHIITSLDQGGAQNILLNICRNESSFNHEVVYLSNSTFNLDNFTSIGINPILIRFNFINIISSSYALFKHIKSIQPHAIQTWLYHADIIGGLLSRLAGIYNITWGVHHSTHPFKSTKFTTYVLLYLGSFLSYFVPTNIIYCAYSAKTSHERKLFSRSRSCVIPNGYDPNIFNNSLESFRAQFDIYQNELLFGMPARFHPLKDHGTLFKSLSRLKQSGLKFSVILAGEGINHANYNLIKLIEYFNLSDNCILIGNCDAMNSFFNAIDVLLLSSTSEAFPNVIFESLLTGTPCVATDVGDLHRILPLQPYLSPISDPYSFSQNILKIISDIDSNSNNVHPSYLRNYALSNFSISSMISKYKEVWSI